MEWYYWVLIGYASFIFLNVQIAVFSNNRYFGVITWIFATLTATLIGIIVTPLLCLISFYYLLTYKTPKYKTFTIHELTEENKTTLRQLSFQEGNFVSNNNLDYDGFRYNKGSIIVKYNGRVGMKYLWLMSREQKYLFKKIKELPKEEPRKAKEGE